MKQPSPTAATGKRPLTLLELNELNFDIVRRYTQQFPARFPNFERLLRIEYRETSSEDSYEKLEPWIQWVSAHSGMTADEHGVFRLGDAVNTDFPQLLGTLERHGVSVGGVSPMNMSNQTRAPAYFIPDPWTQTPTDGSTWSARIWDAISQAVNDNAQSRLTPSTVAWLALAFARFASWRNLGLYKSLLSRARGAPWRKALFLDAFLDDVHAGLLRAKRPQFTVLFLNAGAHIQHHYLFNARGLEQNRLSNPSWYVSPDVDPFGEMLEVYDRVLGRHLDESRDLIVATGLSQVPYDRVKFYYRLKNHKAFLSRLSVPFTQALPRMTRDFLVECADEAQAAEAAQRLAAVRAVSDDQAIFGDIDPRGTSLFVTLTYPKEISVGFKIKDGNGRTWDFHDDVAFVAIKNGMHSGRGFSFFRGDIARHAPASGAHVKALHDTVMRHFGAPISRPASLSGKSA
ncbi:hypothetical protein ACG02S_17785 [Roseateles sp. DC23W]|uniref:Type I phosphodiesterase / nucleotide pyrophosphatase n=1 Tax=Pelomonas dachongensis TaxID=3299029 RepID=A0ABW7ET07_9BURK